MLGRGEPDEAKIAEFKEELIAKLDVYEEILSKQPYMAGQVSRKSRCPIPLVALLYNMIDIHPCRLISFAFGGITYQNGRRRLNRIKTQCQKMVE